MTDQPQREKPSLSVGFVSLGCAKNLVDTQIMAGYLADGGLRFAPSPETADVVLVNTCAFISEAREEAAEAIVWACEHKRAGGCRAVIVGGCLPQRYRDRAVEAFPDVDAFIGVDELESIASVVQEALCGSWRSERLGTATRRLYSPRHPALVLTGEPFAYLKVAEGCNHACAFCAIPGIRGPQRSRSVPDLVEEARALLRAGYHEIDLIAQDVTSYGKDLKKRSDLASLLRALDELDGDFWLRLLYGHPDCLNDAALLRTIAEARHVCAYLDIPIQHSHPEILRGMHRANTVHSVAKLPERLRAAVPGIILRTTCLVGFPGELEHHFEHLLATIEQAEFDHLGVFVYSPEEGTAAFERDDAPTLEVAEERRERLLRVQRRIVRRRLKTLVGNTDIILLSAPPEGRRRGSPSLRSGRARAQAPDVDGLTRIRGVPENLPAGAFVRVRYTGARGYDRLAEFLAV